MYRLSAKCIDILVNVIMCVGITPTYARFTVGVYHIVCVHLCRGTHVVDNSITVFVKYKKTAYFLNIYL